MNSEQRMIFGATRADLILRGGSNIILDRAVNSLAEYYLHAVSVSHLRGKQVHDDEVSKKIIKSAIVS